MTETSPIAPNRARQTRRRAKTVVEVRPQINGDESPLARLARRKDKDGRPMISEVEFNAGEKLRADFFFAAMTPQVTSNWQRFLSADSRKTSFGVAGADLADGIVASRERVRLALKAVGPELSGILIDVCCHLLRLEVAEKSGGWPQRSGKVVLQIALRHLARHYGMSEPAGGGKPRRGVRIRHWGSDDYRPRIEAEQG